MGPIVLVAVVWILFVILAALAWLKVLYRRHVRRREIKKEIDHDQMIMAINYQLMDADYDGAQIKW